ncbi:pentapeptide repeat-containing protein [Kitasatospora sp. NPDC058063]|uniref:pentapeptide repeat-containing protein n=1 Tax=unclassified Kitasatospora TaxID=2633591 RepID=UPI0036DB3BF2
MAGIVVPTDEKLPPGPRRELVGALHGLYRGAGKPSLREISDGIRRRDDLPTTVSHDTASQLLHGMTVPSWARVESIVRFLVDAAVGRQKPDPEAEVERFHRLWLAAEDADPAAPTQPSSADAELWADLRSTDPERRITALYRLERLAWRPATPGREALAPSWPSALADFLRAARPRGAPGDPEPARLEDLQVAVLVLGRLPDRCYTDRFDLSGLDLRNLVWDGARLWFVDLSRSLLSRSSLHGVQLGGAQLMEATLAGVDLDTADLTEANLTGCFLSGASMDDTRLPNAVLDNAVLSEARLTWASARESSLVECTAENTNFRYADLRDASFERALLMNCHFDDAILAGASFADADLSGSSFTDADLSGAFFTRSSLATARLAPEQLASVEVVRDSDGSNVPA